MHPRPVFSIRGHFTPRERLAWLVGRGTPLFFPLPCTGQRAYLHTSSTQSFILTYRHLIVKAELSKSVIKTDWNGKCFQLSMEPWRCQNLQQLEETMKILKKNSCPFRESMGLQPNTLPPTPSEPLTLLKKIIWTCIISAKLAGGERSIKSQETQFCI